MSSTTQKLEALLFVAGEPVAITDIAEIFEIQPEEVQSAIEALTESLAGHGLSLVQTETHIGLATSPDVAEFLASFNTHEPTALSKAAAETLSIIAYRGPLSRYDLDVIRGVDSRSMIRQLLRRGIIRKIQKNTATPLYDITDEFLMHAGVTKREDLPEFEKLATNERIKELLEKD